MIQGIVATLILLVYCRCVVVWYQYEASLLSLRIRVSGKYFGIMLILIFDAAGWILFCAEIKYLYCNEGGWSINNNAKLYTITFGYYCSLFHAAT